MPAPSLRISDVGLRTRSLGLAGLLLSSLTAQGGLLRAGDTWSVDERARVRVPGEALPCLELRIEERALRFERNARILRGEGSRDVLRVAALEHPRLLVIELSPKQGGSKADVPSRSCSVRMPGGTLDAQVGILVQGNAEAGYVACLGLDRDAARARLSLPGRLLLARGKDLEELRARLQSYWPASEMALERRRSLDALWLRDPVQMQSGEPQLDLAYRRAWLQIAAQVDCDGRVVDLEQGGRERRSTAWAIGELAVLAREAGAFGLSRRMAASANELPALARARLGELGLWDGPLPREPQRAWTGYSEPVLTLRDVAVFLAREGQVTLDDSMLHAPTGELLSVLAPEDPRVSSLVFSFDAARLQFDPAHAPLLGRARARALARLHHDSGLLGVRVRWPGKPASLQDPALVPSLGLALWRLRRGDREAALVLLRELARRIVGQGLSFAWDGRTGEPRELRWSVEGAALFARVMLECFPGGRELRPGGQVGRHREGRREDPLLWPETIRDYAAASAADRERVAALAEAARTWMGRSLRVLKARGAPGPEEAARRAREHEELLRQAERALQKK
jgi:hypothetical protein